VKWLVSESSVEVWQLSRALQWRLRRDDALVQATSQLSSAREAVIRGPERGKLKNLHCLKPLLGNGCCELERGLADAVVIYELWRSAIAL
jgi:hypothetical protein